MKTRLKDPRVLRMAVYAVVLVSGVFGVIAGVVDYETVSGWVSDGGVAGWISSALVSFLALANINPARAETGPAAVEETKAKVDELRQIRKGYAM